MYKIEITKPELWKAVFFKQCGVVSGREYFEEIGIISASGYPELLRKIGGAGWLDKINGRN